MVTKVQLCSYIQEKGAESAQKEAKREQTAEKEGGNTPFFELCMPCLHLLCSSFFSYFLLSLGSSRSWSNKVCL